jgi:hypothetical protein
VDGFFPGRVERSRHTFGIGAEYNRDDIHAQCGDSQQAYLPTVAKKGGAICVKPELNPLAPQVMLCGNEPQIAATGARLAGQTGLIPVFLKRGVKHWQCCGPMRVLGAHTDGTRFEHLIVGSGENPEAISMVVELA